ncbi:barstar family protein [Kribbella sp. DT2]|uniref:barstar family protein n=1 Tax=Kribbella sp. DT2 TaxID=3393427 RepID=UPI003CEE87A6
MGGNPLLTATPPWLLTAPFGSLSFEAALSELRAAGGEVISLDGARARTSAALFDQFAEAARFPDYFGRNWPALDECLADLEWLPATCYVVVLKNPECLLEDEPLDRPAFVRLIEAVAAEWSEAVATGEYWDRPSTPFHLVVDAAGTLANGPLRRGENGASTWLTSS